MLTFSTQVLVLRVCKNEGLERKRQKETPFKMDSPDGIKSSVLFLKSEDGCVDEER